MILLIDNYDSFTYNLVQFLGGLGAELTVAQNDRISLEEVEEMDPSHIVLSPGPGRSERAEDFGICRALIQARMKSTPILGVCLGMQGIAEVFGGRVISADQIMHGKTSQILHDARGLFASLPVPMEVMRYHSLVVDPQTLPNELEVSAYTPESGDAPRTIMGLRHRRWPLFGVQFHPESIGTPQGPALLRNFLSLRLSG